MTRFEWQGLDDFKAALRRLPEELVAEAAAIARAEATGATTEIETALPVRTGTLRNRVGATVQTSRFGVRATVRSGAPHALLYERGTAPRHTARGWNRGVMPAHRVFVPTMQRHRARFYEQLRDLLQRAGLEVSGG